MANPSGSADRHPRSPLGSRCAWAASLPPSALAIRLPNSPNGDKNLDSTQLDGLPEGVSSIVHGVDSVHFAFREITNAKEVFEKGSVTDSSTGEITPITRFGIATPDSETVVRLMRPYGPSFVKVEVRRLASLLAGRKMGRQVAPVERLQAGVEQAIELLRRFGFDVSAGTAVGVARIDLAADITFAEATDAQLFLRGLAGIDLPGWQCFRWNRQGSQTLETVGFRSRAGTQFRAYDPTAEGAPSRIDEQALRGLVVRLERQLRWNGKRQPTVEEFLTFDLAALFLGPLGSYNLGMLVIGSREDRCRRLQRHRDEPILPNRENLTDARLEGSLGSFERYRALGDDAWPNESKGRRRRREFRSLGLTAEETSGETFHVGAVIEAVADRWKQSSLALNGVGRT